MNASDVVTSGEIVSYLITLYAVVPSVIITVLYNFLSTIEVESAKLHPGVDRKCPEFLALHKFSFMSSKFFHLTMSYYLVMLLSTLVIKSLVSNFADNSGTYGIFVLGTLVTIAYAFWYIIKDVMPDVPGDAKHHVYAWALVLVFVIVPSLSIIAFALQPGKNQHNLNFGWISVSVLHLVIWWLVFPLKYKPLTNLKKLLIPNNHQVSYKNSTTIIPREAATTDGSESGLIGK